MSFVPIFILGSARSGTTWLGNLLATHRAISGAQHIVHWGLAESRLYSTQQFAGDLRDDHNLIRFLELFASTDYFRLAHGDKDRLYRSRPDSFYQLFFELMDGMSQTEGTRFWVTKLDAAFFVRPAALEQFLRVIDARYPVSRYVGICREFPAVLRSYLNMEGVDSIHRLRGARRAAAIALESGRWVAHNRAIERIVAARAGTLVDYEALRRDRRSVQVALSRYLEIDVDEFDSQDRYRPNSSHDTRSEDASASPWVQSLASRVLVPVFSRFPIAATSLVKLRDRTRQARLPFYWRLLMLEHMPDNLERHLLATSQTALHRALFGSDDADRSRHRFRK